MIGHTAIRRTGAGFTLVEMVTVIILIGVLAVVALPRFTDKGFEERGFHDAAKAALQHARHVAVAARRFVCVVATPGTGSSATLALRIVTSLPESPATPFVNCAGTPIALPSPGRGCAGNEVCAPAGVALGTSTGAAVTVIFDPLGRSVTTTKAVQAAPITLTAGTTAITVFSESGYVQ